MSARRFLYPLIVADTTDAISATTGALQIVGGVGLSKWMTIGGGAGWDGSGNSGGISFQFNNTGAYRHFLRSRHIADVGADGNALDFFCNTSTGTGFGSTAPGVGNVNAFTIDANYVNVPLTADATSTTSGAFRVAGGASIAKSLFVGGTTSMISSLYVGGNRGIQLPANNDTPIITKGLDQFTSGKYSGGIGRWGMFFEPNCLTIGGPVISDRYLQIVGYNLDSTYTQWMTMNFSSGETVFKGTLNVSQPAVGGPFVPAKFLNPSLDAYNFTAIEVGRSSSNYDCARMYFNYGGSPNSVTSTVGLGLYNAPQGMQIDGNGVVVLPVTTASTSTTSGALQVAGGVGIGQALFVGGPYNVGDVSTMSKKYPPKNLTGPTTSIAGAEYGNGTYQTYGSSADGYYAFGGYIYESGPYDQWSGNYAGGNGTTMSDGSVFWGEWFDVVLPVGIKYQGVSIQPRQDPNWGYERSPRTFIVCGWDDATSSWVQIHGEADTGAPWTLDTRTFTPATPVTKYYNRFRFACYRISTVGGAYMTVVNIQELKYFGFVENTSYTKGNAIFSGEVRASNLTTVYPSLSAGSNVDQLKTMLDGNWGMRLNLVYPVAGDAYYQWYNTYNTTERLWLTIRNDTTRLEHPTVQITSTADSTSTTTGAFRVAGGCGIQGSLYVGQDIIPNGYKGRAGTGGALSSDFNITWNGSSANLWIDTTNVGTISVSSDYRIKRNVRDMVKPDASTRIRSLRPITYQHEEHSIFQKSDRIHEGFVAHELQEVIPSAVEGDKDQSGVVQSLNVVPMLAVLTSAVQNMLDELDELHKRLSDIENTVFSLTNGNL